MKAFILLFVSSFLICTCVNEKNRNNKVPSGNSDNDFISDTIFVNGQQLIQFKKEGRFYCLTKLNGDTIVKLQNHYFNLELVDLNQDNFTDLKVDIISNTANQCEYYIYNKKTKNFKHLINCDILLKKIPNKNYYFTYTAVGCAGSDFESFLSKIENDELIDIAFIKEIGCEFDTIKEPKSIELYKIDMQSKNKLKLLKVYNFYDFMGIEQYWVKNCEKLEKK
ncbi:MAG: hypothetical protein ACK5B9_03335 [Flavobacteriia bacterium]